MIRNDDGRITRLLVLSHIAVRRLHTVGRLSVLTYRCRDIASAHDIEATVHGQRAKAVSLERSVTGILVLKSAFRRFAFSDNKKAIAFNGKIQISACWLQGTVAHKRRDLSYADPQAYLLGVDAPKSAVNGGLTGAEGFAEQILELGGA